MSPDYRPDHHRHDQVLHRQEGGVPDPNARLQEISASTPSERSTKDRGIKNQEEVNVVLRNIKDVRVVVECEA